MPMNHHVLVFLIVCVCSMSGIGCDVIPGLTAEVNLQEAVREFDEWFDAHYKAPRHVKLAVAGDGMRLGVVATKMIPAESLYLSIPLDIIIFDTTIFSTPVVGPAIQQVIKRVSSSSSQMFQPQQLALNLFLTYERFVAQNRSFFHPYIQLIPAEHDVPEFYSREDLSLLQGTLIPTKVSAQRRRHREEYNALAAVFRSGFQDVFPLHTFTYDNYAWAQGILNTRMIWWDGAPHLVPLLDMINCRQGPNPQRVHSTKRGRLNRADTYAPWTFKAGDQVFENYGQPNPTYFLWHGFAMEPNFHDCAQVSPSASTFWSKATSEHQRAAQRFQLARNEFCVRADISKLEDFIVLARLAAMSEADVKKLTSAPRQFVSRSNEGKALTLVKRTMESHLSKMKSSEEIDNIASDTESPFRRRMIQLFLRTQRKILSDAVEAIEKKIAPLRRKQKEATQGRDGDL